MTLPRFRKKFGAIYADPPWAYQSYSGPKVPTKGAPQPYETMPLADIAALPVGRLAADNCALFLWVTWPTLEQALGVIKAWGFTYKTCALVWMKGNTLPLFPDDFRPRMGMGYWSRANSEACLLATKGRPKRVDAGVSQVIQAPLRQHSRKPDEAYERIERLVSGPYLELFARQRRRGWSAWGNQVDKFKAAA